MEQSNYKGMKKVKHATYLEKLGLQDEAKEYQAITTREELVNFFHRVLTRYENWPGVCHYIYEMIAFSVNENINYSIRRSL